MFIVVLFKIAETWKQSKRPSVGEWMNELWYIQAMKYQHKKEVSYKAIK